MEERGDPVLALDQDGRIVHANEAAQQLLAPSEETVEGRKLWPLLHEPERERFRQTVEQAFADGEQAQLNVPSRREDRWYRLEVFPMERRATVHLRDITDERRVLDELNLRERALREACEALADRQGSPRKRMRRLLTGMRDTLGTEFATLSYVDPDEGTYRFDVVGRGDEDVLPAGETIPLSELPICARVATEQQTLVLHDVTEQAPDLVDPTWGVCAYLGSPVWVGDEVYGTFCFYSTERRSEAFTDWEITYVELFSDVASSELDRLVARSPAAEAPLLSDHAAG